jgi:hypothetical protein
MAWPRQQTVRCPLYKRTTERGYETGTSTSAHAGTPGHARHGEEGRFAGENERTTSTDAPNWSPKMTVASLPPYFIYNAVVHAPLVAPTPPLIVHGTTDAAPLPEYAQEAYAAALGPKELVLIEAHNHIEFYDQDPYVSEAAATRSASSNGASSADRLLPPARGRGPN